MPAAHYGPELSAFLDGELTLDEQEMIVKHLQTCTDCLLELQDLDAARTACARCQALSPRSRSWRACRCVTSALR